MVLKYRMCKLSASFCMCLQVKGKLDDRMYAHLLSPGGYLCGTLGWSLIAPCVFTASTLLSMRSDAFCALINFRASPIDLFMKGEALVVAKEVTFYGFCALKFVMGFVRKQFVRYLRTAANQASIYSRTRFINTGYSKNMFLKCN